MGSILPTIGSGGAVVRDGDGNDVTPPSVQNAYVPAEELEASCDVTALPSDCTTRVAPAQVNAIVSELLALFWAITPSAVFNCASVTNLATALTAWKTSIGDSFTAVWAAVAGKQPLDEDLTQIAALERANGALIVGGAAAWALLAPGTNGYVLTRNDAAPTKVAWEALPAIPAPAGADGDVQIKSGSGFAASPWSATSDLVPDADNTRDIGLDAKRVRAVKFVSAYGYQLFLVNNWLRFVAEADGRLLLQSNGGGDFDRVMFGGTTASWPALKRATTWLQFRLADDSGYANAAVGDFSAAGRVNLPPQTLTDAANIDWNNSLGAVAKVVLAGNRNFNPVTNVGEGDYLELWVIQNGTGGYTPTFTTSGAGSFDFGDDGVPAFNTAANKATVVAFRAMTIGGTLKLRCQGARKGFA